MIKKNWLDLHHEVQDFILKEYKKIIPGINVKKLRDIFRVGNPVFCFKEKDNNLNCTLADESKDHMRVLLVNYL